MAKNKRSAQAYSWVRASCQNLGWLWAVDFATIAMPGSCWLQNYCQHLSRLPWQGELVSLWKILIKIRNSRWITIWVCRSYTASSQVAYLVFGAGQSNRFPGRPQDSQCMSRLLLHRGHDLRFVNFCAARSTPRVGIHGSELPCDDSSQFLPILLQLMAKPHMQLPREHLRACLCGACLRLVRTRNQSLGSVHCHFDISVAGSDPVPPHHHKSKLYVCRLRGRPAG